MHAEACFSHGSGYTQTITYIFCNLVSLILKANYLWSKFEKPTYYLQTCYTQSTIKIQTKNQERIQRTVNHLRVQLTQNTETLESLHTTISSPSSVPTPNPSELKEVMTAISAEIKQAIEGRSFPPPGNMGAQLQPITEHLKIITSAIKTIKEETIKSASQLNASLDAKLQQTEKPPYKQSERTYAMAAREGLVPAKKPINQHTIIVTSKDKTKTGDKVIDTLTKVINPATTGTRIDKVKKGHNQKVILSCGTVEDLQLIRGRLEKSSELSTQIPERRNPFVIIKDVIKSHTDADIVEYVTAQNKHFLGSIKKDTMIRLRFRKKARNDLTCHSILEVSPAVNYAT